MSEQQVRSVVQGTSDIGHHSHATMASSVSELPARVKKVVTTDEGKLQVVLEAESLSDESVEKVKGLLAIQQGMVFATFDPAQGDLLGYDA